MADVIKGAMNLSADVVNQIAGFAARTVPGVYSLGKTNLINRLKGKSLDTGIEVEVGNEEVAFDIDLVVDLSS